MANESPSKARANHDGWKVSVRNARLIEDGKGSVISKYLIRTPSITRDWTIPLKPCYSDSNKELKLPPLVAPQHENKRRRRIFQRNNPHPRINFPFQTGDRLQTYMIWSADMEPPPFLREKFPPRPKLKQSTNALNQGHKTVYQLEISEMPTRMRYAVDSANYQPPELIRHSPYTTKYSWASNGFKKDNFPAFSHHDVPPVPSYHETETK